MPERDRFGSMLKGLSEFYGRNSRVINLISVILLISSFAFILSVPVWDIDLWWHLATGKYIAEHGSLLSSDPFTYTSSAGITAGRELILNGYWLADLIFYGFYLLLGEHGVILLRVLLLSGALTIIYFFGRKKGADPYALVPFVALAGWVSVSFTGERPQLFSFLLAPLLIWLLESLKSGGRPHGLNKSAAVMLPLLMLLWANMHGGFLLGLALIIFYALSDLAGYLITKTLTKKQLITILALYVVSTAAAALNPNGFGFISEMFSFQGSVLQQRTTEYLSPATLGLKYGIPLYAYWFYSVLTVAVFGLSLRSADRGVLIFSTALLALGLSSFRYIPFFVYATAPFNALYLSRLIKDRGRLRTSMNLLSPVIALGACLVSATGAGGPLANAPETALKQLRFPEAAASFLEKNHLNGNVFNEFNWGGYLGWRLFPKYRVFIDGRNLRAETFRDYTHILWKQPEAGNLLELYSVNIVVMPALNPFSGELRELVNMLAKNDVWRLIYADETSLVFARGRENAEIINSHSLPKTEVYSHVLLQSEKMLASGMNSSHLWLARERAYIEKGMTEQARQAREIALRLRGQI